MNENVKTSCVCELGYDKGVLKKTIENNIFTVYGNINKNSHILFRYHGQLTDKIDYENYTDNLYIAYYFDGNKEKTNIVKLGKCNKCIGENFCALIALEEHNTIDFEFYLDDNSNNTKTFFFEPTNFKFDIKKDPLADVLQKFGIEENTTLPVLPSSNEIQIKKIINNIKDFFLSIFKFRKGAA